MAASATAAGLEHSSTTLAATTTGLGSALESGIATLAAQSAALDTSIRSISTMCEALTKDLTTHVERDSANAAVIKAQSEHAQKTFEIVSDTALDLSARLEAFAETFLGVQQGVVDEIRRVAPTGYAQPDSPPPDTVIALGTSLEACARELKEAVAEVRLLRDASKLPATGAVELGHQLLQEMTLLAQTVTRVADNMLVVQDDAANALRHGTTEPATSEPVGFFGRLLGRKGK